MAERKSKKLIVYTWVIETALVCAFFSIKVLIYIRDMMKHPKGTDEYVSCIRCKKSYRSMPGFLQHKCNLDPSIEFKTSICKKSILPFVDAPKYYQGKLILPPVEVKKKADSGERCESQDLAKKIQCSSPQKWTTRGDDFISWATKEFQQGRPWAPIKVASAKQVVGTVGRYIDYVWKRKKCDYIIRPLFTVWQKSKEIGVGARSSKGKP